MSQPPLCVDLDGTLVATDVLVEALLVLARRKPWALLVLPAWLAKGKAAFKRRVALAAAVDPAGLPYRAEFLAFLRQQREGGRSLYLVTAADSLLAERVAAHLGLFEETFASDGKTNLAGAAKRDLLVFRFGEKGFDYAADGRVDRPVFRAARHAILVGASPALVRTVRREATVAAVFP